MNLSDMKQQAVISAAVLAGLGAIGLAAVVVIGPNNWTVVLLIAAVVCIGMGLGLIAFSIGLGDTSEEVGNEVRCP